MPVIRDYTPQIRAPGPISRPAYSADTLGGASGKALEGLGQAISGVGDVVAKRLDQANTSDVTAKLTKANADLAIDLQKTIRTAEPGDSKAFEDYNKRVDDTIGKIGEEANTASARTFYSEASARIKGQLNKTAADGQSELAGVKAVSDYTQTLNNLSSVVMSDPSSVGLQRELHKQAIENLVNTGQLPRDKAIQLQMQGDTAISKATMRGWAALNPEYAKEKLKSGEFDSTLGADGKQQMLGEIDQAVRAKEIDQERRLKEQERVQKQQQQQTQNKFLQNMIDGKLSTKDILGSNLEAFGSGSKEQFLNMLKVANSPDEKLKTDASTMISLYNRIHLPDGDPNKLIDENELNTYFGRGLSMTDLGRLREEIQGSQTEAGRIEGDMKKQVMEVAKGKLTKSNPLTGFRDPIGDEQFARFQAYFLDEYKAQRGAGKSARTLLDPDSPDYLGKNITQYVRTPQQIMRDMAPKRTPAPGLALTPNTQPAAAGTFQAPKATPIPRQPGESAAAYLKRTKKAD
jgi:hypothetical protein